MSYWRFWVKWPGWRLEGRHHHRSLWLAHTHTAWPGKQFQRRDGQVLRWFPAAWGRRIQAAVPEHAGLILERLAGVRTPFESLETLCSELDAAASRPTEISLVRRGIHLGIQAFFLLPGLTLMFLLSSTILRPYLFPWDLAMLVAIPAGWVLWAFLSRGGLSLPLAGIALVRNDGRGASRLACGWRAFLVWAAPTLLLAGSRTSARPFPRRLVCPWASGSGPFSCFLDTWPLGCFFGTGVPTIGWRERCWSHHEIAPRPDLRGSR